MSSPAIARAIVEELLAAGVTDVVVAPGSRSAPILLTLAAAERAGLVRLHVRIDERSAGYLALGLARGSERPVAVVTTSGTAAVNLHPAVVEAAYLGAPLIAVTADRPVQARGTGANQTIDQRELFGVDSRAYIEIDEESSPEVARAAVIRALGVASDADRPGPVQVNVCLAEPLVDGSLLEPVRVPAHDARSDERLRREVDSPVELDELLSASRGLIIVGDHARSDFVTDVARLAEATGWPVISEPSGNCSARSLRHGPLVLGARDFVEAHRPEVIVTVGRVGLHRSVSAVLREVPVHIAVAEHPALGVHDPLRTADVVLSAIPRADAAVPDPEWGLAWRDADEIAGRIVAEQVAAGAFTGIAVARELTATASEADRLVLGPSFPVRHVSSFAGPIPAQCYGNRGTSGIDGVVSTAWGIASTSSMGTTFALIGDLTAIYDRNGLIAAPGEPRPDLVYVVADNDGGGIFSSLEQGAPEFATDFERVFGTPHASSLETLLAATAVHVHTVLDAPQLRRAVDQARSSGGVHVIVARCAPRIDESAQAAAIARAVSEALSA